MREGSIYPRDPWGRQVASEAPNRYIKEREHRAEVFNFVDQECALWNLYKPVTTSNPEFSDRTDAMIILSHGKMNLLSEQLVFDNPDDEQSLYAEETEERVFRSIHDLMTWRVSREVTPVVFVVGTAEQTAFMEDIAYRRIRQEHSSLQFPVVPVIAKGLSTTSTHLQIEAAFTAVAETQHQSIAVVSSDHNVPRLELLVKKYKSKLSSLVETNVRWVQWILNSERMNPKQARAVMRAEIDRCLEYQDQGLLPKL